MSEYLQQLSENDVQVYQKSEKAPYYYLESGMSWQRIPGVLSTSDWSTTPATNFWTMMSMYTQADYTKYTIPFNEGGVPPMLTGIGQAYNSVEGCYIASIPPTAWRTSILPAVSVTIPITGGTGGLSGLTRVTLYSALVEQENSMEPTGTGVCATNSIDTLLSESDPYTTYSAGLGYGNDTNKDIHSSGIVHLFCDQITTTGATTGATSWGYGWSGDCKYTYDGARQANRDTDLSVGFLSLDSGLMVMYDPSLVGALNTSAITGGTITTGATFSASDNYIIMKDIDYTTVAEVTVTLPPGTQFSTNTSKLPAKQDGIPCEDIEITKACFYNDKQQLTAVASFSSPLHKELNGFASFSMEIAMDGGFTEFTKVPL